MSNLLDVVENPYAAAQRFLERNELPTTYVDEVVQFIEKNTAGVNLGGGGNNEFVDPFTGKPLICQHAVDILLIILAGASRYQSSAASVPTAGPASSYVDPYTGASRYSGAPQPAISTPAPAFQPVVSKSLITLATVINDFDLDELRAFQTSQCPRNASEIIPI